MTIQHPETLETDHLTDKQIRNLDKLATHLESLPEDYQAFSMRYYYAIPLEGSSREYGISPTEFIELPKEEKYACGSAACAIGHGPAAGIPIHAGESWFGYAERVFGYEDGNNDTGKYIFSSGDREDESEHDPHAAAARIREVLAHAKQERE